MTKRQPFDLPDLSKPFIYDLPSPNDGAYDIYGLVFGRESYEEIVHHPPNEKNNFRNAKYWEQAEGMTHIHLRHDWRIHLTPPDPWALCYIWQDADKRFLKNKKEVYLRLQVFAPDLLELMLVQHPKVIELVHEIAKKNYASHSFKPLTSFLLRFFRSDYRRAYEEDDKQRYAEHPFHKEYEERVYIPFTFEDKFQQAVKQFDKAAELVAKLLARHYGLFPEVWTPLLARHADLSEYWQQFTSKAFTKPRPQLNVIKKDRGNGPATTDTATH
jgi:hypothetical protein